jgi:hypothetical protein
VRMQDGDSLEAATVGVNRHDPPGISATKKRRVGGISLA